MKNAKTPDFNGTRETFSIDDYNFPTPIGGQLFIDPMKMITASKIFLPNELQNMEVYGKIKAVDENSEYVKKNKLEVGDIVSYSPFEDRVVKYGSAHFLRMHESAIYSVLKKKTNIEDVLNEKGPY